MEINLFLWPMLLPMILPLVYSAKYKKDALSEIGGIIVIMLLCVLFYWPLLTSNFLDAYTYIAVKALLFVILPLGIFLLIKHDFSLIRYSAYGLQKKGLKKSIFLCILYIPVMVIVTGLIQYLNGITWEADLLSGVISFFEAFTEEFFFRGILFIFLSQKTNTKIAYMTSLMSFILMHPQNLTTMFIIGTIVQGILTLEIARKSQNIIGSWVLHGSNRFFTLALFPLLMSIVF
ncbi:MAG: CPBP family glutamic-type intramembrane protease [Candidatus Thermoplasmatota archaeon]